MGKRACHSRKEQKKRRRGILKKGGEQNEWEEDRLSDKGWGGIPSRRAGLRVSPWESSRTLRKRGKVEGRYLAIRQTNREASQTRLRGVHQKKNCQGKKTKGGGRSEDAPVTPRRCGQGLHGEGRERHCELKKLPDSGSG